MKPATRPLRYRLLSFGLMLASLPLVWLVLIAVTDLPPVIFPHPAQVWQVLVTDFGNLVHHAGITLGEALLGYALANLLALALALLFIHLPWAEDFLSPWLVVIKNVPFVALASVLLVTFGDTLGTKVVVVVIVSFFPLLANLVKGLASAPTVLLDRMHVLHASRWQIFRHVRWPAALPYYLAAHEIAFTGSIIGAIVAEWFFAQEGLGFLIVRATTEYRADRLYAVTLIASLLAVAAYLVCKLAEHRLFRWQRR